jgi:peptide chain release factor 1
MLFDKLRQIEERSEELARLLTAPDIYARPADLARVRKEHAETLEIVERFRDYRDVLKRLGEARHILTEGGDPELVPAVTRRHSSPPSSPACTRSTPSASAGR